MNNIIRIITGVGVIFLVFSGFYFSAPLSNLMDKYDLLHVDTRFTGGEVRSRFTDPFSDDYGAGNLKYPVHEKWNIPGSLDILKYEVFEPMTEGVWSAERHYWQLKVTLAERAPDLFQPIIRIYIDLDGPGSGSTETFHSREEMIRFDPEHPWDIVVTLEGRTERAWWSEADSEEEHGLILYRVDDTGLMVRLPLEGVIEKVLDGRDTYHYLVCGAFDPLSSFLPVQEKRSTRSGWGAESRYTPRVYDYLAPSGFDQESLLTSYNEEKREYAQIYPVHDFQGQVNSIPEIRTLTRIEEEENSLIDSSLLDDPDLTAGEKAGILFQLNRREEAETLLSPLIEESTDPEEMAWWGSLVAMRGGEASTPLEAMELVYEAAEWLNQAVSLSDKGSNGWITALNARAAVFTSVPNDVFGYAPQAAEDYEVLADYYWREQGNRTSASRYYGMARKAWEMAGNEEKADMAGLKEESI